MPVFGNTVKGANEGFALTDWLRGFRIYIGIAGKITQVTLYMKADISVGGVPQKTAAYSDIAGVPDTLLGNSDEVLKPDGFEGWAQYPFPPAQQPNVSIGYYWASRLSGDQYHGYFDTGVANQDVTKLSVPYNGFPATFPAPDAFGSANVSVYFSVSPTSAGHVKRNAVHGGL